MQLYYEVIHTSFQKGFQRLFVEQFTVCFQTEHIYFTRPLLSIFYLSKPTSGLLNKLGIPENGLPVRSK
jgi:hypothetical protein